MSSGTSYGHARHWSDDNVLKGRAYFEKKEGSDGNLIIEDIGQDDEDIYECRVDFKFKATTISEVFLNVIGEIWDVC